MLDGLYIHCLCDEFRNKIVGTRIDKVYQPSRDEVILLFRTKSNPRLFISVRSSSARINFTNSHIENPAVPPMFCMLMRKYLVNAKLLNISQRELERIILFKFENCDDIGNKFEVTLVVELMGRHSNIILVNSDNIIIDSIKRVGHDISRVRQILPHIQYAWPPDQYKINILSASKDKILQKIQSCDSEFFVNALMKSIQGISQIIAKEIVFFSTKNYNSKLKDLSSEELGRATFFINKIADLINSSSACPALINNLDGIPKDFACIPIQQYKDTMLIKKFDSFSTLLDSFYQQKDNLDRIKQRTDSLYQILITKYSKISKKLTIQIQEKQDCQQRHLYQQYGILIQSNLHNITKSAITVRVDNFFDEDNTKIDIPINPELSPIANAQYYFNKYKKMCAADKKLDLLITNTKNELIYLDSVLDNITRSTTQSDIDEIRAELEEEGYVKRSSQHSKNKKSKTKNPLSNLIRVQSIDDITILAGRNNIQNEWLTLKYANKNDVWFHAQKIPGAHVVIIANGKDISQTVIEQAATIAAANSKARSSNLVPVDYTTIKNVKKFKGAKTGMVTYDNFKTIFVKPTKDGGVENIDDR